MKKKNNTSIMPNENDPEVPEVDLTDKFNIVKSLSSVKSFILFIVIACTIAGGFIYLIANSADNTQSKYKPDNNTLKVDSFIKMKQITEIEFGQYIEVDIHTDVLYYVQKVGNSYYRVPIMEADGSCLTYSEWKSSHKGD